MEVYAGTPNVLLKADRSPVTDADHVSEEIVLEALSRLMPDVPVIAEEQAARGTTPAIGSEFFLVDPLDGTKEFLKANGEFTINVALVQNEAPVFGAVYAPEKCDCYLTLQGGRAFRCRLLPSKSATPYPMLEFTPLTGKPPAGRPLTAIVSRSHPRPETLKFLEKLGDPPRMTMGSSLKFGVLARGDADVYPRFGPTSEWDIAAGHALLNAAGGCILTTDGRPLRYGKKATNFTNPAFVAWRSALDAAAVHFRG